MKFGTQLTICVCAGAVDASSLSATIGPIARGLRSQFEEVGGHLDDVGGDFQKIGKGVQSDVEEVVDFFGGLGRTATATGGMMSKISDIKVESDGTARTFVDKERDETLCKETVDKIK